MNAITTSHKLSPAELIRPEIRALSAYHIPDSQGMLKLDAMENPYPWPGDLLDDWLQRLRDVTVNRYPDPNAVALKAQLREVLAIPAESGLILGNGSDELIQLIAMAVAGPGRKIVAPEPSFSMYSMIATFTGMDYIGVPLQQHDFSLDGEAMLQAIEQHQPALVFLAHPNNPTGNLFAQQTIIDIIVAAPGLVLIDEAYFAFSEHSLLDTFMNFDNVLLMRTVSKLGLAGLRLGFLLGARKWLDEIEKLRLPYNINSLTQVSAEFALQHLDSLLVQATQIRNARTELFAALQALPGIEPLPSQANFILLRTPYAQSQRVFQRLLASGVLVKNLHTSSPLLRDCLRITVATPKQNQVFLKALQNAL